MNGFNLDPICPRSLLPNLPLRPSCFLYLYLLFFIFFFKALFFFIFFFIYIILKGKDCTLISAWCSISNYCTILQRILIWINHLHFFYALYKDMERQKIYQFILSSARGGKWETSLRSYSILIAIQSVAQFSNCENIKY